MIGISFTVESLLIIFEEKTEDEDVLEGEALGWSALRRERADEEAAAAEPPLNGCWRLACQISLIDCCISAISEGEG